MEKIYMEENKNKKRSRGMNGSIVLSFVVAAFAVVSLVSVGFNQVSYAAPTAPTNNSAKLQIDQDLDQDLDQSSGLLGVYVEDKGGDVQPTNEEIKYWGYTPIYYFDGDANKVAFCIEKNQAWSSDYQNGATYTKSELNNDAGLMYILSSNYANGVVNNGKINIENLYIVQNAIWIYLYQTNPNEPKYALVPSDSQNTYTATDYQKYITSVESLTGADVKLMSNSSHVEKTAVTVGNIGDKIKTLVAQATTAKSSGVANQLSVKFADGSIAKTSDGKFYQTPVVNVTSVGNASSFDIAVSGVDGAFAVDENGNKMATQGVKVGTKFYIRIPVDKVTTKQQELKVEVTGHFKGVTNWVSGNMQKVVDVNDTNVVQGDSIPVVGAPDTGMNTAQTVYFIGLIVLLCGVGIVYANAKPVQNK